MKKLPLLIAILFGVFTVNAQNNQEGYFSIKDNLIVWTKIYETTPDLEFMKKNPVLEFTSETTGLINKSKPIPLTKRQLDEITANFRIDEKDGRYRVEVSNIRVIPSLTYSLYGVSTTMSDYPLETAGLNKKFEFNSNFLNHIAKPYDNLFSGFFDPKKKNDDW
jgi:hypothetical protein